MQKAKEDRTKIKRNKKGCSSLKHFLNKKKRSSKSFSNEEIHGIYPKFMFSDYLVNCEEAIEAYMEPADGLFSRLVHNPEIDKDIKPQSLWKYEKLTQEEVQLIETLPKGCDIEEQWEQVKEYSPSFNLTKEGVAATFADIYTSKNPKQQEKYLIYKGSVIKTYRLTPNDGMIQKNPDENGHLVFQPYEGFNLAEHIVDCKPFKDFINDEER